MSRRLTLSLCLLVLPWLLPGCASTPAAAERTAATVPTSPRAEPATLFTGRLALTVTARQDAPPKSFSALFELSDAEGTGHLKLLTPLGTQLAEARWSPGLGATLNTGQGEVRYDSLDRLTEHTLGEAIPLPAVGHWLRGEAWPAASFEATSTGFEQLGWQINLSRLPSEGLLTTLRGATANHAAVTLRLKLDH